MPALCPTLDWERSSRSWEHFKEGWKANVSSSLSLPWECDAVVWVSVCQLPSSTRRNVHFSYFCCINISFACLCKSETRAGTTRLRTCGQNFTSVEKSSRCCQRWGSLKGVQITEFRKRLNPGDSFPCPTDQSMVFMSFVQDLALCIFFLISKAFTPLQ